MSSKEKKINKIIIGILIILVSIVILIILKKSERITYAFSEENQEISQIEKKENVVPISTADKVDLEKIIQKNSVSTGYREEITVEEVELEYITKYRNNANIYKGTTQISQEGRNGTQAITTKRVYDENGNLISEEQVSAVVVKSSINKIIDIGTKEYVKEEPKVQQGTSAGLSFDMALNKPSGFTLEQFTEALTDSKDKNKIFQNNAKYFYYIEEQYNINGMFVAAVGIHESAWGTSRIAANKNNLFGYGAYDSNPYNGAYSFESYAEAIDLVARVFVKYYLNPTGTSIYDGEVASGKYYSGNTLTAVNKKYASDKNWANAVYKHMEYLYNKIR